MATPADLVTISKDATFQNRVLYALCGIAIQVISESGQTDGHIKRINYANGILNGTVNVAPVALGVLTNPAIAAEANITQSTGGGYGIPDGDIAYAMNQFFNAFAGVSS